MKKLILYFCSVIIVVILITGIIIFATRDFNLTNNTANNDNPEVLYKRDNSIDLLVYNDTAYVNATDIYWVSELELKSDIKLGEIKRTNVTKKFKDFDATVLEVGTEVYSVLGRGDFVLVNIDGTLVSYYALVEG
ncbi:MAG: hypothetical protein K0S01_3468 [Herbinix sp.]|nr:hypothetical protein [Herbinix sp.]